MRLIRASLAILSATQLLIAGTAFAQSEDDGSAQLTLCNHGDRSVSVALGTIDADPLRHRLTISGWTNVSAGTCGVIYFFDSTTSVPLQSYLAFAYFNQGQFVPAHVTTVPDIGQWKYESVPMLLRYPRGYGPALTLASRRLCVNKGPLEYTIPSEANPDCSALRADGVSGGLTPIDAQYLFQPSGRRCRRNADFEDFHCEGGLYYLDVAPRSGDMDLRASHSPTHADESVERERTPEENVRGVAETLKIMTDFASAVVKGPPPPASRREEPAEFSQQRAQWWKSATQPAASYQDSWIGQIVTIRATVASIGDAGMNVAVVLRETPRNTLTVCPQYPNRLRQLVGQDLNALNGRTIEVTGLVEHFEPCGPGETIRIIEQEQFRLIGAR